MNFEPTVSLFLLPVKPMSLFFSLPTSVIPQNNKRLQGDIYDFQLGCKNSIMVILGWSSARRFVLAWQHISLEVMVILARLTWPNIGTKQIASPPSGSEHFPADWLSLAVGKPDSYGALLIFLLRMVAMR